MFIPLIERFHKVKGKESSGGPKKMLRKCCKVFTLGTEMQQKCCKVFQTGRFPKENVDKVRAAAGSAAGMTVTSGMTGPLAVELDQSKYILTKIECLEKIYLLINGRAFGLTINTSTKAIIRLYLRLAEPSSLTIL